ncbi:MAG: hypothetical protein C4519_09375 [Desulfobacteraceae bacterium]|nr:MAG: hypothetical protein C4519_09375 [Desulfobacteraceae bacterium]
MSTPTAGPPFFHQPPRQQPIRMILMTLAVLAASLGAGHARLMADEPDAALCDTSRQQKIETYLEFKSRCEDRDFVLKKWPVTRTIHNNGQTEASSFEIYSIAFGAIEDNLREYNRNATRIVRTPTNAPGPAQLRCSRELYLERYDETGLYPAVACLDEAGLSYPVALIFQTLSAQECQSIVMINEFGDGDVDIQFFPEHAGDPAFVERVWAKLAAADEHNDRQKPPARMEPIIPSERLRVSIVHIDRDGAGEAEFVLLPYSIDGSFFDQDPHNNAVHVALKYKLITRQDLEGKRAIQRAALEQRLGLWMWNKPVEVLVDFAGHPGPDIAFYDQGIVINGWIIDPKPDGEFDRYEFLY